MDILTEFPEDISEGRSVYTPTEAEKKLGLWVDRTGHAWQGAKSKVLRRLGNFGIVEVLRGTGQFYSLPTGWRDVVPGNGILIFPDIPHFYHSVDTWETRWIVFNGHLADTFYELGYLCPEAPLYADCREYIGQAFHSLRRNENNTNRESVLEDFHALSTMIARLQKDRSLTSGRHALLNRIQRYIRDHCAESLSPESVADAFNMSYSRLRAIVRKDTGRSVKSCITAARIIRAKTLLIDTDLPSKQIADMVGYPDYLYFMRLFKKSTGMTIGEYRRCWVWQ